MKKIKIFSLLFAVLFCLNLCGCSFSDNDFSALLVPPDPMGDMAPVKQALDLYAPKGYTLKYPQKGEYLSPFVVKDLNGDSKNEAVAIYSTTTDGVVTMHIALIAENDEGWQTVNDCTITAQSVESILFSDMNGDNMLEIIVGWNVFGTADKQVAVYSISSQGLLEQRLLERYSGFVICDLDNDLKNELFINYLNTAEKTAVARLFSLKQGGVEEISNCPLDSNITQFNEPVVSTVMSGSSAIYIDAQKGSGMLTEVITLESGVLTNLFYDAATTETALTFRSSAVTSRDFNGDNVIDIPLMEQMPSAEQIMDVDKSYITTWVSVDNGGFKTVAKTIMNYTDGYYIELDNALSQTPITLTRKISSRLRIIYLWDSEDNLISHELFRVWLVSETEWDSSDYNKTGCFELSRSNGTVYIGSISSYEGAEAVDEERLKNMFKLIKE